MRFRRSVVSVEPLAHHSERESSKAKERGKILQDKCPTFTDAFSTALPLHTCSLAFSRICQCR